MLGVCLTLVQCSKKEETTTVKDIDGNVYNIIQIGDQFWLKENLKVTKYRNGESIPAVEDSTAWAELSSGGRCIYDNSNENNNVYGTLYNWYAVNDARGLCPTGWHVPSDDEWSDLVEGLGGEFVAGGKMKTTTLWEAPNVGATNESGFSALPAGTRSSNSLYVEKGYTGTWWSSTSDSENVGISYHIDRSFPNIGRNFNNKKAGYSIRCTKDE